VLVLTVVAAVRAASLPLQAPSDDTRLDTPPSNFVGEGTNELATTLLQGFVEEEKDFVFSPLGYSVILAIMSEGARGETRNQLVSALGLSEDTYAVRQNYKAILEAMKDRWSLNKPEFKNWFYVYENYTVYDAYKEVLLQNYLTEVKHVCKVSFELDFDEETKRLEENVKDNKKDTGDVKESTSEKEKDKTEEVAEKQSEGKEPVKHVKGNKEDEHVKDPNSEKDKETVLFKEVKEESKDTNKKEFEKDKEVKEPMKKSKTLSIKIEGLKEDDKEGESLISKFDASKDITTSLTANPILDRDSEGTELNPETKMIVFNGFYYRGNWKTPFTITKEDDKRSFYKTPSEKKQVTMMQTSGNFDIGAVPELDAIALELPYEGDQYSMLVLLPNQRDGLNKLTADLAGFSLNRVYKYLVNRPVEVLFPKYQIQTISHPEKILQKFGVSDLFSSDADLSGISPDKLKMGALVQLVNFQVDEGTSDTNFLTTTNTVASTRNNAEKFVADHPFLFFIRDQPKNLIITAGKVLDPYFETSDDLAP